MHVHIFWDSRAPAGFQVPVARSISAVLAMRATVSENPVRMLGYDQERRQFNAQALLDNIHTYKHRQKLRDPVLLVVSQDLFRDGHPFVFGLAREQAGAAVVSAARLKNQYYGRPDRDDDLADRLVKEGAHEIGHLLGLSHCSVPECIMFRPDTLDELDRKKKMFCTECRARLDRTMHQ